MWLTLSNKNTTPAANGKFARKIERDKYLSYGLILGNLICQSCLFSLCHFAAQCFSSLHSKRENEQVPSIKRLFLTVYTIWLESLMTSKKQVLDKIKNRAYAGFQYTFFCSSECVKTINNEKNCWNKSQEWFKKFEFYLFTMVFDWNFWNYYCCSMKIWYPHLITSEFRFAFQQSQASLVLKLIYSQDSSYLMIALKNWQLPNFTVTEKVKFIPKKVIFTCDKIRHKNDYSK